MRECLLLVVVAVVLSTPRLWAGSTTPFRLGEGGGVIVPVSLNGHGPFEMLLDTGATHSAISRDVADAIGAREVARTNVISPTSGALRPIVAVDRAVIGPHAIDLLLPSVVTKGVFDAKAAIHGLIGQDVLIGLRYTLDFKQRVIEWHHAPPRHHGIRLPLAFEHGRFMVSLPHGSRSLRLVPDSGAGGLVLFESPGRAAFDAFESGATVELSTANGRQLTRAIRLKELRLGDRTLRNVAAVAVHRPDLTPAEGDGLLPLHLFERVTFDGPSRVLILS